MQIGTNHFVNLRAAFNYYADYGFTKSDVKEKLENGEIKLGPPPNKKFYIHKTEKRYFVIN